MGKRRMSADRMSADSMLAPPGSSQAAFDAAPDECPESAESQAESPTEPLDSPAERKLAFPHFTLNKKALIAGIVAALIACIGMGACMWNQKAGNVNYAAASRTSILASDGHIHHRCVNVRAVDECLYMDYNLTSMGIESVALEQTASHTKLGFSMYYRVYVSGLGWMGWAKEGNPAGCVNLGRTAEKLEVLLIPTALMTDGPQAMRDAESSADGIAGQDAKVAGDGTDQAGEQGNSQGIAQGASQTAGRSAGRNASLTQDEISAIVKPGIVEAYRDVPFTQTIPALIQFPELPYGCESVAATIALQSYGFNLQKTDIATYYLDYSTSDYINAFAGDPFRATGIGRCMPPAIVNAVNRYLEAAESPLVAHDITGASFEELCACTDAGYPVIVWTTQYEAYPSILSTVGKYVNYSREHALVMYGYDIEAGTVLVSDPQLGLVERDLEKFVLFLTRTGNMAVIIK